MKANNDVRTAAKNYNVKHWQIANYMGISEQTFMRWLRTPLSEDKRDAILRAVDELSKEVS